MKAEYVQINGQYVSKGYAESLRKRSPQSVGGLASPQPQIKHGISKNHGQGIRADNPQPAKGRSLERAAPRKAPGGWRVARGFEIVFRVYATRPADWDGYSTKELQDMVVHAGILPDDNWRILQGRVISDKAHSQKEVRTEIEIIEI